MKKLALVAAVVLSMGIGTTSALSLISEETGKIQFLGCFVNTQKKVQCELTFIPNEDGEYNVGYTRLFMADGNELAVPKVSLSGRIDDNRQYARLSSNLLAGVPVKVGVITDLPSTTTSIRALLMSSADGNNITRFENISVRNSIAPVTSPTASALAQAPAAVNISGNWNATLTNCRQSAPGTVVCVATLKK